MVMTGPQKKDSEIDVRNMLTVSIVEDTIWCFE